MKYLIIGLGLLLSACGPLYKSEPKHRLHLIYNIQCEPELTEAGLCECHLTCLLDTCKLGNTVLVDCKPKEN